jgi:DNA-binding CsgD family transcriptional regulator
LFEIQRKSKDKYEALYLASTFHIAEMTLPYAPKFSHKLFKIILKKNDSNVGSRLNYHVNLILGNECHSNGDYLEALKFYYKCYNKVKPEDAYLNAKALISIALCELSIGKTNTAKSHIDLSINLLKEKGNLTITEKSGLKFMESVNSVYFLKSGNVTNAKETLERNYDTKFKSFVCIYRYENVASNLLDVYISEGNKKGYTKIFNDLDKVVNSNIETKYKINLLKIMHDNYEKIGRQDLSKIQFNRLNAIYFQQEKLKTSITENVINLLIDNENKTSIANSNEIINKGRVVEVSIICVLMFFGLTIGYKKYYSKDISARRAIVKINEVERKQEVSNLNIEKLKEEITNLNLVLNMKTDSEKALIEKIKEYKKDNSLNAEQILVDFQMQLNNLIQIDLKNTSLIKNTKGETDVFFDKVKSLHPALSPHDLNLCSYIRLKLNSKEISLITGITPGSVRVYKTKLKNKLGLKNEENLNQYLQTI